MKRPFYMVTFEGRRVGVNLARSTAQRVGRLYEQESGWRSRATVEKQAREIIY